ncbi:unnamed protein product [Adineta steineri]|uniref:Uncharacterized protein n=2 Tax=Adineta steineri TaxID=433720 RepID=A0A815KSH5_9BILA|nr:unnamed protein product [Adineta steineri]CAF3879521.1 unnamed protein product [Adineta steineri]
MQLILQIFIVCILLIGQIFGDSCKESCTAAKYTSSTVLGTAPFCNGRCADCQAGGVCLSNKWSEGKGCWTGSKACCCWGTSG